MNFRARLARRENSIHRMEANPQWPDFAGIRSALIRRRRVSAFTVFGATSRRGMNQRNRAQGPDQADKSPRTTAGASKIDCRKKESG